MKGKSLSRIRLLATPWTAAYHAPSFIEFSRQEYWSGVPLCSRVCCHYPSLFQASARHQEHLEGVLKHGLLYPILRVPDSVGLEWGPRICISNIFLWRRRWHPTPVLLPRKSHGQGSLIGCGPWGREESDTTEQLPFHFSLSCIGEGNGNPLQCSCLENPRDGGAWWAAVYGVAQSRTRLK